MLRRIAGVAVALAVVLSMFGCGVNQKSPQDYYDMGVRYLSEGNYEEAVLVFSALLEIEPNHVQALTGRGQALQQLGGEENLNSAQEDYQAALDIDDSDEQIWLALADLLLETGAESDAKDLLAQAYEKFGSSEDLSGRIARLQESGALEGEDLSRFGLVADNTADFQPVQLSQAEADEIVELLTRTFTTDMTNPVPDYNCLSSDAEKQAIDFIVYYFHTVYSVFYSWEDITLCENYAQYDNDGVLIDDDPKDPLGQFDPIDYGEYYIVPGEKMDWILHNIYNVTPEHPETATSFETTDFRPMLYYYYNGDYYCTWIGGIGGPYHEEKDTVLDIRQSGNLLYLQFRMECTDLWEGNAYGWDRWVLLRKNTVEDREVWSLLYGGMQPLDDISGFLT